MININDIRTRLISNPEPQEVTEIRNRIISTFKDLEFQEGPHKYYLHSPTGEVTELPSVSKVIHQFEPERDWDSIRIRKANKEGIDPEVLKRQWRETNLISTSNGTKTHFFLENLMKLWIYGESGLHPYIKETQYEDGYMIPYGVKEKAGSDCWEMILGRPNVYPIMPEAKIYTGLSPEYKFKQDYCGTFDLLMAEKDSKTGKITPFLMDWKGLPLDTPILTNTGFVKMEDLKEGDLIYDRLGNLQEILHVSEIHENPCYEITFKGPDGSTSIVADQDHRWEIFINGKRAIKTTKEIKNLSVPKNRIKVCIVPGWEGENRELKEDPLEIGKTCQGNIPGIIMGSSREQRKKVLEGLMKSSGEYYEERGMYGIKTKYTGLVKALLGSLGITTAVLYDDFILFSPPFNPCPDIEGMIYPQGTMRCVDNIKSVPTVKTRCIEVSGETHTYLAGYDLLVTHNTNKSLINDYSRNNRVMLLPPFQDLYDEPLSMYTLQLSCYQMGIQQLGYDISYRMIVWLKDDGTYEIIQVPDLTEKLKLIL